MRALAYVFFIIKIKKSPIINMIANLRIESIILYLSKEFFLYTIPVLIIFVIMFVFNSINVPK